MQAYFPLPLFYIRYHLCKIAYEYKVYDYCKENAKVVFSNFTERTELKDLAYDNKLSCLLFYKLKYDYIQRTCFLELEGVAYTFLYFAKCMMILKHSDHSDDSGINIQFKQKNVLKNLNVLMLGLEVASYIRHFTLIKLFVNEIYSITCPLLKQKNLCRDLTQLFIRLNIAINLIPHDMYNIGLRNLSAAVSYQLVILLINNNEGDLYKKVLIQELGINKKKYYQFPYNYMKKLDDGKKLKPNQVNKDKVNLAQPEEEKFIQSEAILIKDLEKETIELDEFILSIYDYNDIVRNKLSQYLILLDKLILNEYGELNQSQLALLTPEIENRKKEITELIEVWEGYRIEGVKFFQKFAVANRETSDKYYEYSAKMLKRTIDNNYFITKPSNLAIIELLKLADDIQFKDSDITHIMNIYLQKLSFLSGDVIFVMKRRIQEFLNKIEKEISEEKNKNESISSNTDYIAQNINLEKIRIQIEEKYFGSSLDNEKTVPYESFSINEIFTIKEKYFWIGDIIYHKSILLFIEYTQLHPNLLNYDFNNFLTNYKLVDITKIQKLSHNDTLEVSPLEYRNTSNLEKNFESRTKRFSKIFEKLATASLFMNETKSYVLFDNLMNFAYNILLYDMMTPLDAEKDNIWCSFNIVSEIAIQRLDRIKQCEEDFTSINYISELKNLKKRLNDTNNIKGTINFHTLKKYDVNFGFDENQLNHFNITNTRVIYNIDEEKLLEFYEKRLNLDVYVEFICFTIQSTFQVKKWNVLTNLIQKFNYVTNDHFCDFTLSYLIEAQKNIYERAYENVKIKQLDISHRVALYETWKNSRKKIKDNK